MPGAWIQSYTGKAIRILEPTPEQVDIRDIAHALSLVCRFAGHTRSHYSVAQHSALVAEHVPQPLKLIALLHDAAEAYIGDIVTPLKRTNAMRDAYLPLEEDWAGAIGAHFGLDYQLIYLPDEVKTADLRALLTEKRDLLAPMDHAVTIQDWLHVAPSTPIPDPFPLRIWPMTPDQAERRFIADFCTYGGRE